jgi:predicted ATPase
VLIGRDALLRRLETVVARAQARQFSTALVAGPAGIGKTALVRTAAATAAQSGVQVGWGTAVPGGGVPAYWPCSQALNTLARATGLARARAAAEEDVGLVASVITALGPSNVGPAGATQVALLDAITRWLSALASKQPQLLVVDDLQWADMSSLNLLAFLAAAHPPGLAVIGAYRDDELTHQLRDALAPLVPRRRSTGAGWSRRASYSGTHRAGRR